MLSFKPLFAINSYNLIVACRVFLLIEQINAVGNFRRFRLTTPSKPTVANPSGWVCGAKSTCGQMASCEEAKFYLTVCGVKRLDGDGVPCASLCR